MLEGEKNIGSVELSRILLEAANLTQVKEQLATWTVLQTEVQLALSLERTVHSHDKL